MKQVLNMHKELAMTGKISAMAKGGLMKAPMAGAGAATKPTPALKPKTPMAKGLPMNPITVEKRNNGVVGMKKGGKS